MPSVSGPAQLRFALCQAHRNPMKRSFRNQILTASVIAACAGCSAGGHLYSLGTINVPTVFDHFRRSSEGYYLGQCRVPFDALGREIHDDPRKVTQWQTFTEVGVPGHCWHIRGSIWMLGVIVWAVLTTVFVAALSALSHFVPRMQREEIQA